MRRLGWVLAAVTVLYVWVRHSGPFTDDELDSLETWFI
jgi:hypothetical protein